MTRSDWLLLAILLLLAIWSRQLMAGAEKPVMVVIRHGNELVGEYPLNKDRTIEIAPGITSEIRDGQYRMVQSTCPGQVCVEQGWNSRIPVICAPKKVSITIVDASERMPVTY